MRSLALLAPFALAALAACSSGPSYGTANSPMAASPAAPYSQTAGQAGMNESGDTNQYESGAGPAGVATNPGSAIK